MAVTKGTEYIDRGNPIENFRNALLSKDDSSLQAFEEENSTPEQEEAVITHWKPSEDSAEPDHSEEVADRPAEETEETSLSSKPTETPESKKLSTDTEVIWVKDENGKKVKLEVTYADKLKIRDAFVKAAGMRKFQAERDLTRKEKADLQTKFDALSADFGKLDSVFREKGAKGLFETLAGPGAWDDAVKSELRRRDEIAQMSPHELEQLKSREREDLFAKEKADLDKRYKDAEARLQELDNKAQTKTLESKLNPAFEKYRFSGKLGDADAEHAIDEAIWTKVTNNLAQYPDEVDLSQALIDKEFRSVSALYRKVIDKQTDVKLKQAVDKQKSSAAAKAEVAVKKGMTVSSAESDMAADIKNSNWSSIFQKMAAGKLKF